MSSGDSTWDNDQNYIIRKALWKQNWRRERERKRERKRERELEVEGMKTVRKSKAKRIRSLKTNKRKHKLWKRTNEFEGVTLGKLSMEIIYGNYDRRTDRHEGTQWSDTFKKINKLWRKEK